MAIIGTGVYPLNQAAKLVGAEPRALRRWLLGYTRKLHGQQVRSEPLWTTQLVGENVPDDVIGFRDLLEARMVAAFVKHGVDLRVIRATIAAAASHFNNDYPLTQQKFLTDGTSIFMEAVEQTTGEQKMIDLARRQFVFKDIIKPSLYAGIEYDDNGATRWFPLGQKKSIVLDPDRQFGTPILTDVAIPTDTIFAAYQAEGRNRLMVARVFDITPEMVNDAVEFEERFAA